MVKAKINSPQKLNKRKKMKTTYAAITTGITACLLVTASALHADDKDKKNQTTSSSSSSANLSKATNTVTNIQQSQPPQESTTTKKSAAGLNASEFRPKQQPIIIKEPPSPVRKVDTKKNLNPNNDPDVARGLGNKK